MPLMLLLTLALAVWGCGPRNADQSYKEGYSAGWQDGHQKGKELGFREGYSAGRPEGWSPNSTIGRYSLGAVAFLGGCKVLIGLIAAIWYIIQKSSSEEATIAKIIATVLSGTVGWLAIILFSAGEVIDSFLFYPAPSSFAVLSIIVLLSTAIVYIIIKLSLELLRILDGTRVQIAAILLLGFFSSIIGSSLVGAIPAGINVVSYLITYCLIGVGMGAVFVVISLLVKEDDKSRKKKASKSN